MTRKLPARALCERYQISDRTLDRWTEAGVLPPPMYIRGRRYWDQEQIEQLERERMAKAVAGREAAA
jgi:DNA-binding transcriptional MerR regulator